MLRAAGCARSLWAKPSSSQETGVGFRVRAQLKIMDKAKNASLHDMVIHVINKYSLSTHYVPGTVVSALEQNRQRKGLLS